MEVRNTKVSGQGRGQHQAAVFLEHTAKGRGRKDEYERETGST